MKRLFLALPIALLMSAPAAAQTIQPQPSDLTNLLRLPTSSSIQIPQDKPKAPEKPVEPPKPEPVVYTVVEGDTLTSIGTANSTEWQRLWAKNTQLTDPDIIHPGDKITVPLPDEALSRDIPANTTLPASTPGVPSARPTASAGAIYDGGNTYDYGYCTWYVKNRRGATIPNSLGNANTWYSRAAALGMAVGTAPRAGAVGATSRGALGHVVYVESVNGDGTVNISEMNYSGFGVVDYRTAPASEFVYIY